MQETQESACLTSGLGRFPRGGHGNPLQYSCLENPHGQRTWRATVTGSQRVGQDWATEHSTTQSLFILLNWNFTPLITNSPFPLLLVPGNHDSTLDFMILTTSASSYKWEYRVLVILWLISPNIMPSGFVHIVPYCRISFFKVLNLFRILILIGDKKVK